MFQTVPPNIIRSFPLYTQQWYMSYRFIEQLASKQHCYLHASTVRPEAATAVVELLMMGMRTPETC